MGRHGEGRVSYVDGRRVLCGAFGGRESRPPIGPSCYYVSPGSDIHRLSTGVLFVCAS